MLQYSFVVITKKRPYPRLLKKLEINYTGVDPIMGTHEDVHKEVCGKIKNQYTIE